jgi:hypothetical protein
MLILSNEESEDLSLQNMGWKVAEASRELAMGKRQEVLKQKEQIGASVQQFVVLRD